MASLETNQDIDSADTFKILLATDIHLGYAEKHPIRGQDSFVTFEEILQQAVKNEVDFLLLGGDLFHDSRPSPYCIYKCLELLRRYCLGDKPINIEFLSDQSCNFQFQKNPIVNYEDPNLNIGIPVFSIHGNHDDPTGQKQVSAMDVISSTGLINYFGRWNSLTKIEIRPILLQKGDTKLALYGLSHIKDERLGRLFREKKIHMKKPDGDDWFNILVLHQNRAARGVKNFIPDSALPEFLHLVVWGHEHDCKIEPEAIMNNDSEVFITQPGSSVATSLAVGESIPKKIGLLLVNELKFKIVPIPLKTVRPFVIDELVLENPNSDSYCLEKPAEQAVKQVTQKINKMIKEAGALHADLTKPAPLPLLRLKVFYYDDRQQFNVVRLGMQFTDRIANPDDTIKLNSLIAKERRKKIGGNFDEDEDGFANIVDGADSVEDVITQQFQRDELREAVGVLSVKGLNEAVTRFVKSSNLDALNDIVEKQVKRTINQLLAIDPESNKIEESIESLRKQRMSIADDEIQNADVKNEQIISISDDDGEVNNHNGRPPVKQENDELDEYLVSTDDELPETSTSTKAKKSAASAGRGGRGSRARGTNRGRRGKKDGSYATLDSFCK